MQAMPFHLQATTSGGQGQPISTSKVTTFEENSNSSPVDSEPTSTLDSTPSPPTISSSKSSTTENAAVLAQLHHGSDNVYGLLHNGTSGSIGGGGGGGGGAVVGMEEWDSMFPNGDGALLPWIMGDGDDLGGVGLKHLLQSGVNHVEFEVPNASALVGVAAESVEQGSGLDSASSTPPPPPPPPPPLLGGGDWLNNGKIGGSILPNSSSGVLDSKVGLNPVVCGSMSAPLGNNTGGFVFPQTHMFGVGDEKPFNSQQQLMMMMMNPHQTHTIPNPSFFMPSLGYCQLDQQPILQPHPKRHNPGPGPGPAPFLDPGHEFLLTKQHQQQLPMGLGHPQLVPQHLQQKAMQEQVVKDQLFKAADLIQTGNFALAQEILARLNHHLTLPGKPLVRAALYAKEALQTLLSMSNPSPPKTTLSLTPLDVVHRMSAYKAFSEVSPITQFVNFTVAQSILEALNDSEHIHVIDFDIGCGVQWAPLIQELPLRKRGAPSLKITAMAPLSLTHPFELSLVRENLAQFASDIGVAFEMQVLNMDLFELSSSSIPNVRNSEDQFIAVNIPIWASSHRPSILPSILRFIKQQSPKIVLSLDRGFDRFDTPFPQHLIHLLESSTTFLESLEGLSPSPEVVSKVEKYFLQPRIENTVLGRVHAPDKMPHWKTLFASAGLVPVQFSNFTETQADYVVKRMPGAGAGRGFHIEKRQAVLVLSWQRRELVVASAWRFEKKP